MECEFRVPDHAQYIEAVLEGFIRAAELMYRCGAAPRPHTGWKLVQEPPGRERWQLPDETEELGECDCEDLVIAWAGYLRATGEDSTAGARILQAGPGEVHCLLTRNGAREMVDVYTLHANAQGIAMNGWWSSLKRGARKVGRGLSRAAHGVAEGVHYVAHDLPGKVIHEATSGIKDVAGGVAGGIRDIGEAGAGVVNAAGDLVASGAGLALHQVGKLAGSVVGAFQGGLGDDVPQAAPPTEVDQSAESPDQTSAAGAGYAADGGGEADYDPYAEDPFDHFGGGLWGTGADEIAAAAADSDGDDEYE